MRIPRVAWVVLALINAMIALALMTGVAHAAEETAVEVVQEIGGVGAIGLAALPAIVAGLIGAFRSPIERYLTSDVIPPLAILLGVGVAFAAQQGGAIEYANLAAIVLVGVNVGLAAIGTFALQSHYRKPRPL